MCEPHAQAGSLGRAKRSVSMPQLASNGELDLEDGRSAPLVRSYTSAASESVQNRLTARGHDFDRQKTCCVATAWP